MSLIKHWVFMLISLQCCAAFALPDHWTSATAAELNPPAESYFRIDLRYPGVYRITEQQLMHANNGDPVDLETIALMNRNQPVPFYRIQDEASSRTVALDFVADSPRDEQGRLLAGNRSNIFHLVPGRSGIEYRAARVEPSVPVRDDIVYWRRFVREENFQFLWTAVPPGETDNFYWHVYQAGVDWSGRIFFGFPNFASELRLPVEMTIRILGENQTPQWDPDHKFHVAMNDHDIGTLAFDGIRMYDYKTTVPAEAVKKNMKLSLTTPEGREQAIDKVAVDRVHVSYASRVAADNQEVYWFSNEVIGETLPLPAVEVGEAPEGSRVFDVHQNLMYFAEGTTNPVIAMGDQPTSYVLVGKDGLLDVDGVIKVEADEQLVSVPPDTKALIVYHPRTRNSARALATYRTEQGLKTLAVDVTEIFDRINEGFVSDVALKRYIRYVADQAPHLEFIVLFGDSTYDFREARHIATQNHPTVLIPIHWVSNPQTTWSGGFQDDNWYGAFTDEYRPDIAVGRIPANNDDNGMTYLRKIIEHEQLRKSADAQALMVSSVEKSFQELVKEPGTTYQDRFSTVTYLFPETEQADKEVARLTDEITTGAQLLYYVGHGGSMVWRVGPSDFSRQKDLFTPRQVKQLNHPGVYPFVLCSSCYTTSFDHELGIGESLLFQPDGGAIAVVGSPWKATVHEGHSFNRRLIESYVNPEVERIGQGILHALHATIPAGRTQPAFNSFTLLGDPCVKIVRKP